MCLFCRYSLFRIPKLLCHSKTDTFNVNKGSLSYFDNNIFLLEKYLSHDERERCVPLKYKTLLRENLTVIIVILMVSWQAVELLN